MTNSQGVSIYDIVGHRHRDPVGWAPGFGPVPYHRRVNWLRFGGGALIGLGAGLFIGTWARWRRKHD